MTRYAVSQREESEKPREETSGSESGKITLDETLQKLERINSRLSVYSWCVIALTVANLLAAITAWLSRHSSEVRFSLFFNCLLGASVLAFAIHYENLRKRGDVLFEEISDELQWNIRGVGAKPLPEVKPSMSARLVLRTFARASDMPLIPGKLGPVGYVAINLLFVLLSLFLLYLTGSR